MHRAVWTGALLFALMLSAARATVSESAVFVVDTSIPRLDRDSDGLPDSYENNNGLNPNRDDTAEDADGDGLTNLQEYNAGTNPQVADWPHLATATSTAFTLHTAGLLFGVSQDSDADGMPDWWEARYNLNRQADDALLDSDMDGLINRDEYLTGGNPATTDRLRQSFSFSPLFEVETGGSRFDTDSDGLPDWWERVYFGNPTAAGRNADTDADGHGNYAEYIAGTDPTDSASVFSINLHRDGNNTVLRWSSVHDRTYSIWRAGDGALSLLESNLQATPPLNAFTNREISERVLYRVSVVGRDSVEP